MTEYFTGGCQCGAVRFRVAGPLRHASICNCRMCQKAVGNIFAAWADFDSPVEWTRGEPTQFRSSVRVRRGFCSACGTPLTYQMGDRNPSITVGSFDRPNEIIPTGEVARDNRHPIVGHADELDAEPLGTADEERDFLAIMRSYQHPDEDTDHWTPGAGQ